MANKKMNYNEIYQIVMQCRSSGLSDRQWCIDNDIVPSTFYNWIRKLRTHACYEIPENSCHHDNATPAVSSKQEVVCVNIVPDAVASVLTTQNNTSVPFVLQYHDATLMIPDDFNDQTLKRVLHLLKESLC